MLLGRAVLAQKNPLSFFPWSIYRGLRQGHSYPMYRGYKHPKDVRQVGHIHQAVKVVFGQKGCPTSVLPTQSVALHHSPSLTYAVGSKVL